MENKFVLKKIPVDIFIFGSFIASLEILFVIFGNIFTGRDGVLFVYAWIIYHEPAIWALNLIQPELSSGKDWKMMALINWVIYLAIYVILAMGIRALLKRKSKRKV